MGELEAMTSLEKAEFALRVAEERKAQAAVTLDLRKLTLVADFFLICEGTSAVHIRAVANALQEEFGKAGLRPLGCEGYREARWVLLDFGDLVIHIFAREEREYYALERLWADAPRLAPARRKPAPREE